MAPKGALVGLRTLVYSIFYTLKALIWSLILLLMMMYLVGILLTDAVLAHVEHFASPSSSLWSSASRTDFVALRIPSASDDAVLFENFGSLPLADGNLILGAPNSF